MKSLNRKLIKLTVLIFSLATIFVAIGSIGSLTWVWGIGFVLLLIACILWITVNRCPYCGVSFKTLHPFALNAGYCGKCGKLMELR